MRNIVNISLPSALKREVDQIVKRGNYASVSEFFRDAIRSWKEDELLRELHQSQKEIAQGKGKVLKSLADLD